MEKKKRKEERNRKREPNPAAQPAPSFPLLPATQPTSLAGPNPAPGPRSTGPAPSFPLPRSAQVAPPHSAQRHGPLSLHSAQSARPRQPSSALTRSTFVPRAHSLTDSSAPPISPFVSAVPRLCLLARPCFSPRPCSGPPAPRIQPRNHRYQLRPRPTPSRTRHARDG